MISCELHVICYFSQYKPRLKQNSSLSLASDAGIRQINQNTLEMAEDLQEMHIQSQSKSSVFTCGSSQSLSFRYDNFLRIVDWLSPLNFFTKQKDVLDQRQDGTGLWVLESDAFERWEAGIGNLLWCPGIRESRFTSYLYILS